MLTSIYYGNCANKTPSPKYYKINLLREITPQPGIKRYKVLNIKY